MNAKNQLIAVLFLILSLECYTQNDWRPGYLIENSGDTISGLIDYRSPKSNSAYCYFKTDEDSEFIQYSPRQIQGYRFNGDKLYFSKTIEIDSIESVSFLELLISGKANLYSYTYDKTYYFLAVGDEFYELKNSEKEVYIKGSRHVVDRKEYVGVMNYLFEDANITGVVNKTRFDQKSLINTTKKYHTAVEEEYVIYENKKTHSTKVNFGLVYGYFNQTLDLDRNLRYDLLNGPSNYLGVAINIQNIPTIYERFSFQLELISAEYLFEGEKSRHLNIPAIINYKLSSERFYPQFEFGLSMYVTNETDFDTQHATLTTGLSFHYDITENNRFFLGTRFEFNPGIIRFGGGLFF